MNKSLSGMCPYLGSWRDESTAYMYPTSANCCNAGKSSIEIDKPTQERLCLTSDHATCARFVAWEQVKNRTNGF